MDGFRPMARHRRFSKASVPLLSPRDTNGARAAAIARKRSLLRHGRRRHARDPPLGPTITKSFQAIWRRSLAMSFGDEAVFGLGVVDQHQVGIAARRRGERLAGALGEDPHLDAVGRGEGRQDMLEQPRILHRRRRGQDDRIRPGHRPRSSRAIRRSAKARVVRAIITWFSPNRGRRRLRSPPC